MVVLAIAAILTMVAWPSYQSSVRKTHRGDGKVYLTRLESQFQVHRLRHGKFPAIVITSGTATKDDIVVNGENSEGCYALDPPSASTVSCTCDTNLYNCGKATRLTIK
jgi:Tfp pilus assembly protein PilE